MTEEHNKLPTVADYNDYPLPFCATRGNIAPLFTAETYVNNEIQTIQLEDFRDSWVVLFFYASDFTFV